MVFEKKEKDRPTQEKELNLTEFTRMLDSMKESVKEDTGSINIYLTIQTIIQSKNPEFMFITADELQNSYPIQNLDRTIAKIENPEWCYMMARYVKGCDKKMQGLAVIHSKDPCWNYLFAKDIPEANKEEHLQVVLNSKHPRWNFESAMNIEGADTTEHGKAIEASNSAYYKQEFKNHFGSPDTKEKSIQI